MKAPCSVIWISNFSFKWFQFTHILVSLYFPLQMKKSIKLATTSHGLGYGFIEGPFTGITGHKTGMHPEHMHYRQSGNADQLKCAFSCCSRRRAWHQESIQAPQAQNPVRIPSTYPGGETQTANPTLGIHSSIFQEHWSSPEYTGYQRKQTAEGRGRCEWGVGSSRGVHPCSQ